MFRRCLRTSPISSFITQSNNNNKNNYSSLVAGVTATATTTPFILDLLRTKSTSSTEFRGVKIPWESPRIPTDALTEKQWENFGREILSIARGCDAGPAAFEEALIAREQLETMLEGAGYNTINVAVFGGAVVNGVLELGGDVDFVAVCDQEPSHHEASQSVINMAKELRRLGLRSTAVPRARVPVVKTDRVSVALPGAPMHPIGHSAVFRYVRPATPTEQGSLEAVLKEQFGATRVEWNGSSTLMATFPTTTDSVRAIAWTKSCGQLDIPLRLPVDPRHGPEIYRYTFDLCLNSSGLQNSHLFRNYLAHYPFGRHLLLFLKRWARACGIVNTYEGMLASYAVGVMVIHFLVRVGVIPPLQLGDCKDPQALPKIPEYKPLEDESAGDVATLGFLTAHYLDYYANVFNYESQVVCTTTKRELSKSVLRWNNNMNNNNETPVKPPFFSFCIKDPYNTENIARNINPESTQKIKALHGTALQILLKEAGMAPKFVSEALIDPNGPAVAFAKHQQQNNKFNNSNTNNINNNNSKSNSSSSSSSSSSSWKNTTGSDDENVDFAGNNKDGNVNQQQQQTGGSSDEATSSGEHQPAAANANNGSSNGALSPEAEARRELSKMAFQSRKESLNKVGEATARTHEQNRVAQDLTRSIVNWIRAAEP